MEFNLLFKLEKSDDYILWGLSEITEICVLSALENNKKILSIIDNESKKKSFLGIRVLNKIEKLDKKTKIILTKIDKSQDLYNKLCVKFNSENIIVIRSLCISKRKPNFNPREKK
tara:strand:+ start:69 stop:413 length:345 start_codon:yes stop_codon:yes gene_type:complete